MVNTTAFFVWYVTNDKTIDITVLDEDGAVVNISAATEITWKMAVDENTAAVVSKSQTGGGITLPGGGTDGIFRVDLDPADSTGLLDRLYYQESVTTLSATVTHVATGMVRVRPAIPTA